MKTSWRTAWQGQEISVYREEVQVDRLAADRIERVVLMYTGFGESPGDLVRTVVETDEDVLIFPVDTGFAGRVNFERESFWAERACVFWVPESRAAMPLRLRRGASLFGFPGAVFQRLPRSQLVGMMDRWPLQGPQTWEQRKWSRIQRSRPFAPVEGTRLGA